MFHDFGASSFKRTIANCTGFQTFWSADARNGARPAIKVAISSHNRNVILLRTLVILSGATRLFLAHSFCAFVRRVAQRRISPLAFDFLLVFSLPHYFVISLLPSVLHFAERLIQQADALVHVSFGDVEHRREPQHVAKQAAFTDEQAVVARALHHLRGS